jgi:hypothetical protein
MFDDHERYNKPNPTWIAFMRRASSKNASKSKTPKAKHQQQQQQQLERFSSIRKIIKQIRSICTIFSNTMSSAEEHKE